MKKTLFIIILSAVCIMSNAQIKMHPSGQVSIQSTTTSGGVQIDAAGKTSFEPNITLSYTALTQTKAQAQLVRAWNVRYEGTPTQNVKNRFYVTGIGNVYSVNYYTIGGGGGSSKGSYPIENASKLLSSLNGFYYDNNEWEGF